MALFIIRFLGDVTATYPLAVGTLVVGLACVPIVYTLTVLGHFRPFRASGYVTGEGTGESVLRRNIQSLASCLTEQRWELLIVAGEGHHEVYNVVEPYFRQARERGLQISVVCGPVLLIPDQCAATPHERARGNALARLAQDGVITLYCSWSRRKEHFRVGDAVSVYRENPHEVEAPTRNWHEHRNDPIRGTFYRDRFRKLTTRELVKISHNPGGDFLFLTKAELGRVVNCVASIGLDINHVGRDDLVELCRRVLGVSFELDPWEHHLSPRQRRWLERAQHRWDSHRYRGAPPPGRSLGELLAGAQGRDDRAH